MVYFNDSATNNCSGEPSESWRIIYYLVDHVSQVAPKYRYYFNQRTTLEDGLFVGSYDDSNCSIYDSNSTDARFECTIANDTATRRVFSVAQGSDGSYSTTRMDTMSIKYKYIYSDK